MTRLTVLLMTIVLTGHCLAQGNLFVMHPLLGDTIVKSEKLNYFLFPQINDSNFKYCTITQSPEGYFANTHTLNDSVYITPIDSAQMRQTIVKLDLVMQYYSEQEKKEASKGAQQASPSFIEPDPTYPKDRILDADSKDRIFKETRRDARLRDDAARSKQVRQGTELSGGGRLELFSTGRKKRK